MDITAYDNEGFVVSFEVTAFSTVYELDGVAWHMQVRKSADTSPVYLDMKTSLNNAFYSGGVCSFTATAAQMKKLSGDYVWDFGFTPPDQDFVRCDGGSMTVNKGITR